MAESVLARVRRVLSGRIEDSVDAMERANSDGTMREAIREVDRALDEVRGDKEAAMTRRLQAARQQEMIGTKIDELTGKAKFALQEGREDLAEGALIRQVDLESQFAKLEKLQALSRIEEQKLEESMTALQARKSEMEEALAAFTIARSDASMGGDDGLDNKLDIEKKIRHAEAAFDRAMTGAGGIEFSRSDAKAINAVAELDTMQKGATVAERLAALKQESGKAA
ncbi:PspA/IM30 family protein [Qipengyuania sp. NPDC077563]|uniref:PspA/IM30 family protein n=1 Tax=Qipengyuania sp. NPDC077563 TaxID=3364497 RepID=UPI003850A8CD